MKETPHISIKAETLFHIGSFPVSNSYASSVIVLLLFLLFALYYAAQSKSAHKQKGFYLIHFMVTIIYGFMKSVSGDKIAVFFPWLGAFFFYILFQNWFGLLPGVGSVLFKITEEGKQVGIPLLRADTADLNATIALALVSVALIQFYGVKYLGFVGYTQKFLNFKNPMNFVLGILETVSELSKVLSFSFRLYGNIFAGEVLLTIMAFLVPILASFPFLLMEVFVGLIQALVFSMLTAVFLNVAVTKHH